jgi:Glycosyl hydrolase catalytic core
MKICNNNDINFLPYLWGQTWDDSQLSGLPNDTTPWGIIFENEPNWWGGEPLIDDQGAGANMTASFAAGKYPGHVAVIDSKWDLSNVKMISPESDEQVAGELPLRARAELRVPTPAGLAGRVPCRL